MRAIASPSPPLRQSRGSLVSTPRDAQPQSLPPSRGASSNKRRSFSACPQARVLYDYMAKAPNELSINVGEVVRVVEKMDEGWWEGERYGQTALFPATYVEMM